MAKKLMINCGTCDARNLKEETLQAYEHISINCGDVIVTPESKVLLNTYGVTMNCGAVRVLEKDVKLRSVNGRAHICSGDLVTGRQFLEVNGILEIGAETQSVLGQYVGIAVNGKVLYPESISGSLEMLTVNGTTVPYPDGAVILKRNAVIDRTFALRARQKLYWSEKRMIFADPKLDPHALRAKGPMFRTEEVILAESFVEPLVECIDEKAEIILVPDGTVVVTDDLKLNALAVEKYGPKLYVLGNVDLDKEDREALSRMEYLNVRGDAKVPSELKALLLEKLTELAGQLHIKKSRYLRDKISLRISKEMLEQEPEGIQAEDCVNVTLDEDIPASLILERLSLRDCVTVRCTPEQEGALHLVSEDVVSITSGAEGENSDASGIGSLVKSALSMGKELLDTKIINAGDYIL